ncbi:hypothetical protein AYO40_00925 [Planctomycetaceae bacterium SCGC AG-212-D15]|nr:hypothetical protein AYO40_00925 [Planctomycetaceae bacterium SCGC AG-212-D15]
MSVNGREFLQNCGAHSAEELAPYVEKYVAWSEDGKNILASANELSELYRAIADKGIKDYVVGFVPSGDLSYLGGVIE